MSPDFTPDERDRDGIQRMNPDKKRPNKEAKPVPEDSSNADREALAHELEVHQIELEMQADELRVSQQDLEKSQSSYLELYDFAPVGYLTLDGKALVTEANLTLATLLGIDRALLINRNFGGFIAPADRETWDLYFADMLGQGGKKTCTLTIRQADGLAFPARLEGVRITANGEAVTIHIAVSDITDIWQIEALKDSELKYRNVIANTPAGYFRIDLDGRFQEVNDAWLRMHGFSSRDEVIGQHFSMTQVDTEQQRAQDNVNNVIMGENIQSGEFSRGMKDGSVGHHTFSAVPVTRNGKIVGLEGFLIDITGRRKADEERGRALERLSLATKSGHIGIWELDPVHNILIWDEEMFLLYGITPGSFSGTYEAWRAGVHPDDLPRSETELQMALRGEKEFDTEFRVVWPDGTIHYVHANARVYRDSSGKPVSLLGTNYDVTERRLAGEALRVSEEKQRILIEESSDPLFLFTPDGRYSYANKAMAKVYGKPVEEIIGRQISDFLPGKEAEMRVASLEKVFSGGETAEIEGPIPHPDGDRYYVTTISPVINSAGIVIAAIGSSKDITPRKQVEDSLRESEDRFRKIFENSPLGMALVNPDFRFFSVNPAWVSMTGYSEAELLERSFGDITHPDYLAGDLEHIRELVAGIIPVYRTEKRYIRKEGSILWGSLRVTTIRDKQGNIRHFVAQIEDITDRKRADDTLRESEVKFRTMVEASPDIIWEIDPQGNFTYISSQCHAQLGYEPGDLIGQSFFSLVRPEAVSTVRNAFLEHLQEKRPYSTLEVPAQDKAGKQIFIEIRSVPITGSKGQITGFRGIARDITHNILMQTSLKESERFVQQILDTTPNLVYIFDIQDNRNIYTNREVANYLGYSSDEIIRMGSRLFEIILHPEDAGRVAHHHAMLGKAGQGEILELEYRMKNADGQWRWLRSRDTVFARDKDGNVQQILGVTDDITNQKNATEAIIETGAYTRSLIEAAIDPLVTITKDGTIGDVNAATEHATGYSRAELIGMDFSDYFTGPEKARTVYRKVFETGSVRDYPLEIRHRDGRTMPVLYNATVFRDATGSVKGVFAAARDITNLKATQEALQYSERKYRDLAELMPQTIFETDLNGRFTYANRFALNFFGYDISDIERGLDISQMLIPDDVERAKRTLAGIVQGSKKSGNEYRFLLKNGGTFTGITYISVIEKDGRPFGLRGIIADITERKHNEDVLRLSHTLLECANRTLKLPSLLQEYVHTIKEYTGCDAIGIRLLDEKGNIPDFKSNALDNFLPGYAILFMYEQTHL
ncbi:MAG: PAS domain S-box protein, partial [Methanomicrobiales archaeon]